MSVYRHPAPRVPDWEPPLWLRLRISARNFDWSALKPDPNKPAWAATILIAFLPVILLVKALELAWWLVRLVAKVALCILLVLVTSITGDDIRLYFIWK